MKRQLLTGLAVTAIALSGCSDAEPNASAETGTPATNAAEPTSPDTSPADTGTESATGDPTGGGDVVEITAVDYAFEDVPETVPVGTELTLVNESDDEVHEMVVMRVDDDQTMALDDILAEVAAEPDAPPPDWVTFTGISIAMTGEAGFEPEGPVVLDEPGRYLLMCFIPTGADPDAYREAVESGATEAPDVGGGAPHVVEGMAAELVVQ